MRTGAAVLMMMLAVLPFGVSAAEMLVPMGCAVGIELEAGGVIIAGFSEVDTENGKVSPAETAGLLSGDVITAIGDRRVSDAAGLLTALNALDGTPARIRIVRNGRDMLISVTPAKSREGRWQLGLWLRDSVSGIGTVTYYDPGTGAFGALGHGINDTDSGKLLPFDDGSITGAAVVDVVKGAPGAPARLFHGLQKKNT